MKKAIILSLFGILLSPQQYAYSGDYRIQEDLVSGAQPLQTTNSVRGQLLQQGVIVRVWSGELHGGENVGHVSLETARDYISFWPDAKHENGHFMSDLSEDLEAEDGRDPEVTTWLLHPKEGALEELHKDFNFLKWLLQKGRLKWTPHADVQRLKHKAFFSEENWRHAINMPEGLMASSTPEPWAYNCASLVLDLLENNHYLDPKQGNPYLASSPNALNATVTPDNIATICATKYLKAYYKVDNLSEIVKSHAEYMKSKGIERFSYFNVHHIGRLAYKSSGSSVQINESLWEDVVDRLRDQQTRSPMENLACTMDNSLGVVSGLAGILGKERTEGIIRGWVSKK